MEEFVNSTHNHNKTIHVDSISNELKKIDQFQIVSDIFKQLSDTTRVRIFWLLSHEEECVANISCLMNMSSPAVSHHLRSLYECGLITSRRVGKEVYYKAKDNEECKLLHKTLELIMEIVCPEAELTCESTPEETAHVIHDYLIDHIADRITIEELSKMFLMNTTTIKTAFKNVYGTSLAAHMKKHRMEMAANLLVCTMDSISQIALAVGYESQSRFCVAFKETYNMLPTEYRKQKQKSKPIN